MPRITVTLPTLIADTVGRREVAIDADTLGEALRVLRTDHAELGALLFDDTGAVRRHVLIFHNDTATRWLDNLDVPLKPEDRLDVVQAISGGCDPLR